MVKVLEYMAYGVPVVMFDLLEGRRYSGDRALYVSGNGAKAFGEAISLGDPELRQKIGGIRRKRVKTRLNWALERQHLVDAYQSAITGVPLRGKGKVIRTSGSCQ